MEALILDVGELEWLEKTRGKEMGREGDICCVYVLITCHLEEAQCLKALSWSRRNHRRQSKSSQAGGPLEGRHDAVHHK